MIIFLTNLFYRDFPLYRFEESIGKVLQFPKSEDCHTVYCNIEGIHWINDEMILAVSDKMKGRGKQDYRCLEKDQSIHAFVLPSDNLLWHNKIDKCLLANLQKRNNTTLFLYKINNILMIKTHHFEVSWYPDCNG